jgi:2-aminobenzoate-CoA ligase
MSKSGERRRLPAEAHLPPGNLWPRMRVEPGSVFDYPRRLNCARELLDRAIERGAGENVLFRTRTGDYTYASFARLVNRIAHVLVDDYRLKPGERVLIGGPNTPVMAACWFAVLKAGGVCTTVMTLVRAYELTYMVQKADIELALYDAAHDQEIVKAQQELERPLQLLRFNGDAPDDLTRLAAGKPDDFDAYETTSNDVALLAFTSGTTGSAKGTMHLHRDVLAICDAFPRSVLKPEASDIFCGTPPFAFTFGLGGLLLFPMRFGASIALSDRPSPAALLRTIRDFRATICFTAPTGYRAMLQELKPEDVRSLRKCVSAGEPLPATTFLDWERATGLRLIDGLGTTEMLHIFISAAPEEMRPGATGKPIPGYEARIVDNSGNPVGPNTVGLLAVRGVTGCRYFDDESRQLDYVRDGWNYTGDAYSVDEEGYFHFHSRADDLIVSAGYNISPNEVEGTLLQHPAVAECAVIGTPDPARGQVVKAFIRLEPGQQAGLELIKQLQDFVKERIAPYKYPRVIEFIDVLPRTATGKVQRFRLRQEVAAGASPEANAAGGVVEGRSC